MVESVGIPVIKDSGKQREFGTGAIRDFAEGKGRCDLLPLEEVAELLPSDTIKHLAQLSKEPANVNHIYAALRSFADEIKLPLETLMIEASSSTGRRRNMVKTTGRTVCLLVFLVRSASLLEMA